MFKVQYRYDEYRTICTPGDVFETPVAARAAVDAKLANVAGVARIIDIVSMAEVWSAKSDGAGNVVWDAPGWQAEG